MRSVKTKIVLLVMACAILAAAVVGTLSMKNATALIQEDSTSLMNQICQNRGQEINAAVSRIEQSVDTLGNCILNGLDDLAKFQSDAAYVTEFTDKMENILHSAAQNTQGAMTAYLRYNPDFTQPTSGLFFSKNGSGYEKLVPTDFSIYDKSDTAHVGWYYTPVQNNRPTWMPPYLNGNIQVTMISYVVPLTKDGVSVGIVGMDIDFSLIQQIVDSAKAYQSGYAFLADQSGTVLYHPDSSIAMGDKLSEVNGGELASLGQALQSSQTGKGLFSYQFKGVPKSMAHMALDNGMKLVLTAPVQEINQGANRLMGQIIGFTLAAAVISIVLALILVRGIVRPLQELNRAAVKIADGNLEVTVLHRSRDEIGTLAESISRTAERLREYGNYIGEISSVLEKIAAGNLVFRLEFGYEGEFAKIKQSLQHISRSLNSTMGQISQASGQVALEAGQVASSAQALSQGSAEQASSVQKLSEMVSVLSEQVARNATNTTDVHDLSSQAGSSVQRSSQYMREMTEAMADISEASQKIQKIAKTVEDISSQTNILALNAAVEAARAGEAGKGFSVVADEVRSLAEKAGDATKNITVLIQNSADAIRHGVGIVEKTEESLSVVIDTAQMIEKKLGEISNEGEGQAAALQEVTQGIERISAVVQANSDTAREEADASRELSGQSLILENLLKRFTLDGEAGNGGQEGPSGAF